MVQIKGRSWGRNRVNSPYLSCWWDVVRVEFQSRQWWAAPATFASVVGSTGRNGPSCPSLTAPHGRKRRPRSCPATGGLMKSAVCLGALSDCQNVPKPTGPPIVMLPGSLGSRLIQFHCRGSPGHMDLPRLESSFDFDHSTCSRWILASLNIQSQLGS